LDQENGKQKGEEEPSPHLSDSGTSAEVIEKTNRHNEITQILSQLLVGSFKPDMLYYSRNFVYKSGTEVLVTTFQIKI
jgi:hypothetical protein